MISANPPVDGVWAAQGLGDLMMYNPIIPDHSYNPPMERSHFSYPISSITPVIQDDCTEAAEISLAMDGYGATLENNVKYTLGETTGMPDSTFGFTAVLSYQNPCNVGGMWFDLEFAHHAEQIQIDVADDGDVEYAFTEPAFDMFGRQTKFISSKDANDVHYGTDALTRFVWICRWW